MTVAADQAAAGGPGTTPQPLPRAALLLGLAAFAALTLALRLPIATSVIGLVLFGILHNVLELRYVTGQFAGVLAGRFLTICIAMITAVAACRLMPTSAWTRATEIVITYALISVAWWWARGAMSTVAVAFGFAGLTLAATASLTFPGFHFVMLAHLHNVVPLFFLWEWSRRFERGRTAFRVVNLVWVFAVPALLLAGAFDAYLRATSVTLGGFGAFDAQRLSAAYTPSPWLETQFALRFLAVFAFMQTMHYVVWVYVLPRYAPDAARAFEARVPWLVGGRAWALGIGGGLVLLALFAHDWATGKAAYASIASYHAYLEFPVLIALLLGLSGVRSVAVAPSTHA